MESSISVTIFIYIYSIKIDDSVEYLDQVLKTNNKIIIEKLFIHP
jgi:membrane protease subunit (stomatin/prohibitin family)